MTLFAEIYLSCGHILVESIDKNGRAVKGVDVDLSKGMPMQHCTCSPGLKIVYKSVRAK